jgi:hypothetical protein
LQDLLWRSVDDVLDMDKQGGMGNIPMHQAKVLDRRTRLEGEIGNLEEVFGHDHLRQMVASVRDIRALLRVKMEDSNDLQVRVQHHLRTAPPTAATTRKSIEREPLTDESGFHRGGTVCTWAVRHSPSTAAEAMTSRARRKRGATRAAYWAEFCY